MLLRRAFAHKCRSLIRHPLYAKFFCPDCHDVSLEQFERHVNYFSLFFVPQTYAVDKTKVAKQYRDFQMLLHPDILQARGIHNQEYSKCIGLAYTTLHQDVSRALYLLKLHGHALHPEQTLQDAEFMEEMFDLRCELHSDCSQAKVAKILLRSQQEKQHFMEEIAAAFAANDMNGATELTLRLQFYEKLATDAKGLLTEVN